MPHVKASELDADHVNQTIPRLMGQCKELYQHSVQKKRFFDKSLADQVQAANVHESNSFKF